MVGLGTLIAAPDSARRPSTGDVCSHWRMSNIWHAMYIPHVTPQQQFLISYSSLVSTLTVERFVTINLHAGACVGTMHYGIRCVHAPTSPTRPLGRKICWCFNINIRQQAWVEQQVQREEQSNTKSCFVLRGKFLAHLLLKIGILGWIHKVSRQWHEATKSRYQVLFDKLDGSKLQVSGTSCYFYLLGA